MRDLLKNVKFRPGDAVRERLRTGLFYAPHEK
jgi:hypothetical protein